MCAQPWKTALGSSRQRRRHKQLVFSPSKPPPVGKPCGAVANVGQVGGEEVWRVVLVTRRGRRRRAADPESMKLVPLHLHEDSALYKAVAEAPWRFALKMVRDRDEKAWRPACAKGGSRAADSLRLLLADLRRHREELELKELRRVRAAVQHEHAAEDERAQCNRVADEVAPLYTATGVFAMRAQPLRGPGAAARHLKAVRQRVQKKVCVAHSPPGIPRVAFPPDPRPPLGAHARACSCRTTGHSRAPWGAGAAPLPNSWAW